MSRRRAVGTVLFFVLVVATLASAVLVVRARTPDLVLEVTEPGVDDRAVFSPEGDGETLPSELAITFFVRESDDAAFVGIVDRHEDVVRTLEPRVALAARRPLSLSWDGRTDDGDVAQPGRYRLVVRLPSEDREMVWPRRFTLIDGGPG